LWADCAKIIKQLKRNPNAGPYNSPVDPIALSIPDYPTIITNPMDLSTVESKLNDREYETLDDFAKDVRLIWKNAEKYNGPEHPVSKMGQTLSVEFEKKFSAVKRKELSQSVARVPSVRTPAAVVSPPGGNLSGLKIKAKVNLQEMSYEEKKQLCQMVNNLESKHLHKIVQILHKGVPLIFQGMEPTVEEIDINIESLDTATLRELERYVKNLQ